MAKLTNYMELWAIDHMFRGASYGIVATQFVGLYTGTPSDIGDGAEVSGGGYARQPFIFNAAANIGGVGQATSNAEISFGVASATYGNVVAAAILDKVTGGTMLMWSGISAPKQVNINDTFKFNAGDVQITFD